MYLSIFTDELYKDTHDALPIIAGWGINYVDFRSRIKGKPIENLSKEELIELKRQLNDLGLKTAVLQTSLCKSHLPDREGQEIEIKKLDGIIRAADILDTRLIRSFNFWQREPEDKEFGHMSMRPDIISKVLELFYPIAKKAKEGGLILGFENCGQTHDEVIALVNALDVPNWGLAWDVSNYFGMIPETLQGDSIGYFTKCLKYANMVHVKSLGLLTELKYEKVPWDRVLRAIVATGKDIPISIETHNTPDSPFTHQEASYECYKQIKKVWPLGVPSDIAEALNVRKYYDRPYTNHPVSMVMVGATRGQELAYEIIETPGISLNGIYDINIESAKRVGESLNIKYSDDINIFLNDPSIEAMYIDVPKEINFNIIQKCLIAGKNVLVSCPISASYSDLNSVHRLAKDKGLLLEEDYKILYDQSYRELCKAIKEKWFGSIINVNLILNLNPSYVTGNIVSAGIDEIACLISVLGIPKQVKTLESEVNNAVIQLKYDNGCNVNMVFTKSNFYFLSYSRLELFGTEGSYVNTVGGPEGNHIFWFYDGKWTEAKPYVVEPIWQQSFDHFAYCIRMEKQTDIDFQISIKLNNVMESLNISAKNYIK